MVLCMLTPRGCSSAGVQDKPKSSAIRYIGGTWKPATLALPGQINRKKDPWGWWFEKMKEAKAQG